MSQKIYDMITDRIVGMLENGVAPWKRTWSGSTGTTPRNLVSKRPYRGINHLALSSMGFGSDYWMTYRQAKESGGQVKKGETGFPVIFWKKLEVTDQETGEGKNVPFIRYYTVFNLDQIDGVEPPDAPVVNNNFDPIMEAEKVVACMQNQPIIVHEENRAFYRPSTDTVNMPRPKNFHKTEYYYSTLFHELVHSTGHEDRLARPGIMERTSFGSNDYSKEELVAEMGAAFLCAQVKIDQETLADSASYLQNWIKVLKGDSKLAVQAASAAQRAADYVIGGENGLADFTD